MASYLLKADDETMARWKKAAADRGVSFAEFVRGCLDEKVGKPGAIRAEVGPAHARVIVERVEPKVVPVPPSPRRFIPDFKRGGKK